MKLLLHAAAKLIAGFMLLVVLLFWPAGTWCFWPSEHKKRDAPKWGVSSCLRNVSFVG